MSPTPRPVAPASPTRIAALTFPPGPRRRFPGQFALALSRDRIGFLTRLVREYGDVVQFPLGPERIYLLSHPDLVRDVLVTHQRSFHKGRGLERARLLLGYGLLTSEGEFHLRQRRLVQPAFHRTRLAAYATAMTECAARQARTWRPGSTIDVHESMMATTLAVVGRTLFGTAIEGEAAEVAAAVADALTAFNVSFYLPLGRLLERLPIPPTRRFRAARARLDATIYRLIAQRRREGQDRGDLLSMLLLAADTEGDGTRMTDAQLRDEAMTLFLAGHETTANALTWTWYLLSQHPEAETRLHAELDAVLGTADGSRRLPTVEDLARLPYARMVLAESMRLYPPAWVIGRRAIEDVVVGGVAIPARSIVMMSQYIVHRDPRFFPDPDTFRPERWTPEQIAERPKLSYFPFGAGTRVCVGEQFAWMEGVLVLATIARGWRLRLARNHPVALQPIVTLRPKHGMTMVVDRR